MTDPKDAKPPWPTGLNKILKEYGVERLVDILNKKPKTKEIKPEQVPRQRLPYVDDDIDTAEDPD